ncbi:DNA-binding transcriptional regulator, XRE-family HTH domain [Streptomyces sp. Ag82_O1-12]|nr:DNA-binding transcriptional regulator, XRE-family HTH domain [Streptomyces sp. Ag82_O1-12]SOD45455.1 DNA-binding transcriptional regulator, XRE-family HTH domain [Streptomyces sp. Ag82_G6-1]
MQIYNQLRVLRAERGLSRVALAKLVEVHPQTIGAIERGDYFPSLDLAFRLSDVFELPVEAIFNRKPFAPLSAQLYNKEDRS